MITTDKITTAILKGSIYQVQQLILDGENIDRKDEEGRNYLHLATHKGSVEMVKFLIDEGLDVNDRDNDNLTPLHRACRSNHPSIVRLLLDHGAKPNAKAKNSTTPLHIAAAFDHYKCIEELATPLENLDLNARDDNDHTPLHFAAADGHYLSIVILVKCKANVDVYNKAGNRPLHFVAASEMGPSITFLLQNDSKNIDSQNSNGQTALHLATLSACEIGVGQLLEFNANPNIKDNNGDTCLHLALKRGHTELVEYFLHYNQTDTSICDNEQNTVLHVAIRLGHYNLIKMMLPSAKDLTVQNAQGCTVMIEAIKNQLEDLAVDMVKICPSLVHKATHELVTPLHLAAERGMTILTRELLIAGANVDSPDSNGLTPSLYCAKNDSVLECLAMIEDIMMAADNPIEQDCGKITINTNNNNNNHSNPKQQPQTNGNSSQISSRISS